MRREERRNIPRRGGDDLVRLPDDMIFEILLRLPVKCLLRFKCVCTGWLSLISCPWFAKSHLKRGIPTTKILAAPPFQSLDCQLLDLDERHTQGAAMYLRMPAILPEMGLRILGSCDGLVSIRNGRYMFLWNPATGMFLRLPRLRNEFTRCFILYGIGYDLASDDYKVIVGFMPLVIISGDTLRLNVFSLKRNAWRERSHRVSFKISWDNDRGVFVGDAVHWIGNYAPVSGQTGTRNVPDPIVVSMRMSDESIGEVVLLPGRQYTGLEDLRLAILRSRLALHVASHHGIEVWMMNEYGVRSSWTKLFAISVGVNTVTSNLHLLEITRRGNIIASLSSWVLLLERPSLKAQLLPIGGTAGYGFSAVAYTESLVSPTGFQPL